MANFRIADGKIYDPDGKVWIGAGPNIGNPSIGDQLLALFPGVTLIRIALGDFSVSPNNWSAFIKKMTALKIVCLVEHHPWPIPDAYTGAQLTTEVRQYAVWAGFYRDNPYVWFGTMNEPQGGKGMGALSDQHVATYNAIRGAGASNVILLEAGVGAGNPGTVGPQSGLRVSDYAAMTGVAWDLHQYGWMSQYKPDQNVVNAKLLGSISSKTGIAAARGMTSRDGVMPVVVAEFGPSTTGRGFDANGDQVVYAVSRWAITNGYTSGFAGWHWDLEDLALQTNGKLTRWGTQLRDAITAARAMAGGSTPAPIPAPTPAQPAPSPNNTVVTSGGTITDAAGNRWTITSGAQVAVNGQTDINTGGVISLAYVDGVVWQQNAAKLWWGKSSSSAVWSPPGGTATSPITATPTPTPTPPPTPAPPPPPASAAESSNGTWALTQSGAVVNSIGERWTITSSNQVAVNGATDRVTANIVAIYYANRSVYHMNTSRVWYMKAVAANNWQQTPCPVPNS